MLWESVDSGTRGNSTSVPLLKGRSYTRLPTWYVALWCGTIGPGRGPQEIPTWTSPALVC
ncbi:hypothetical protein ACHAW6_004533 [Cyclotella cf. meneghiniana]